MNEGFKLPVSSYDELMKVINAYGNMKVGISVSLDELNKASGMGRTVLSKNNGFLIQVNLISRGSKKAPTELCKKLANAYSMGLLEEVSKIWRSIVEQDEFMSKMISVVNIKKGISKQDYIKHIVFASGCGNSPTYKAGASALVEVFKRAGLIDEDDGNIVIGGNPMLPSNSPGLVSANTEILAEKVTEQGDNSVFAKEDPTFYIQQYTCESGLIAKIIIPDNASPDDLLGFRDMLNIALRRKFKLSDID